MEGTYESPSRWLRYLGIARIGVMSFVTIVAALMDVASGAEYLAGLYLFGFASSIAYLHALNRHRAVGRMQTWAQCLVDFAVVALTVALTQGPASFFTFLFVVVVLEAGLLLGLRQSFVFATFASIFILEQWVFATSPEPRMQSVEVFYNFLVQCMAFYLTAFIASYWNQRVTRMQAFQREIVDNMSSGFLIADIDGRIVMQNMAAQEILATGPRRTVGRSVNDVLRADGSRESPIAIALRRQEDFTSYEFRAVRLNGSTVPLGLTTNLMRDAKGSPTGIIASFTDLTEINRMREDIRKHDRMAVVGELAAGLAHEIRNPLAVIRGAADELSLHSGNEELQERLRSMVLRESRHLNEIVGGFLDFARDPSTVREAMDLAELIDDVGECVRQEFGAVPTLSIDVDSGDALPPVLGDRAQLKQVLVNLARNGIEAMEARGTLRITALPKGGHIEVRIDDDGPGIPPSEASRIFEPFYTTKAEGVGMGLAVCMRIITAHNGDIEVGASPGGGCSMRVKLPVALRVPAGSEV